MYIKTIKIHNFKRFKDCTFDLQPGVNILVGNNEVGKSTILEAIHLALSGFFQGRYLRNGLSQYLFNVEVVEEYLNSFVEGNTPIAPPNLWIELYFDDCPLLEGNHNSGIEKAHGLKFEICYDDTYDTEYNQLVANRKISTLPIEYYKVEWKGFNRDALTSRGIPLKSVMIDSSNQTQKAGDVYLSHLIKNCFDDKDKVSITQAYRKALESFMGDSSIADLNAKLAGDSEITEEDNLSLGVDLSTSNAWEDAIVARLNTVPMHYAGKGVQSEVKTKIALAKKPENVSLVMLVEEPENHLSYSRLNKLLSTIRLNVQNHQVLISTHSSFVLNKLGLSSLLLLSGDDKMTMEDLSCETLEYFKKLSGYDTLRMILAKKSILVEGDSDELLVQKCYQKHYGHLPIEDGVDVQCAHGLSFLRYLEIAEKLHLKVCVVTDNDGNIAALEKKYENYIGKNAKENIRICYSTEIDGMSDFGITEADGEEWKTFNFNTLETKMLKANSVETFRKIFGERYNTAAKLLTHMHASKGEAGLKFFETIEELTYPSYIISAIQ